MSLGSHAGEVAVPGAALETGMISLALGSRPGSSGTGSRQVPAAVLWPGQV